MAVIAMTDTGNAEAFATAYSDRVRYEPDSKSWYAWTGHYWAKGGTAEHQAERYAAEQAEALPRDTRDEQLWQRKSLDARGITNTLKLAKGHERILIHADHLDADPYALNTPGGVVDLRTGELRDSDPAELHTMSTTVTPAMGAPRPKWEDFLQTTFGGDTELIDYLQEIGGLILIGETLEPVLPFFHGHGRNGKTTLINVWMEILGISNNGYAVQADPKLLTSSDSHPTGVMALRGARLAVCSELQGNEPFNEALLKGLTGGDLITARKMRQDFETFKPSATLVLGANTKPPVRDGGASFFSRLRLIPCAHMVPPELQDKTLKDQLVNGEGQGILGWMLEGAVRYLARGTLNDPSVVITATEEYRNNEDPLRRYIAERCVIGDDGPQGNAIGAKDFANDLAKWLIEEDLPAISSNRCTRTLERDYGVRKGGASSARKYQGISWK